MLLFSIATRPTVYESVERGVTHIHTSHCHCTTFSLNVARPSMVSVRLAHSELVPCTSSVPPLDRQAGRNTISWSHTLSHRSMAFTFSGPVPIPTASVALTVLVTGASRGLGLELVRQYAAARPDNIVFAAVRSPEKASDALTTLAATASNVHIVPLDVADEGSIRSSVQHVSRATDHLDLLINNAAVVGEAGARDALTVTASQLTAVFHTNTVGPLLVTQVYLPLLLRSPHSAKVLNVSSAAGSNARLGSYGTPNCSYGLSKAALVYLTGVFRSVVPSVTFLAVSPGWVDTDMGNARAKAPTTVGDAAQAIRYYVEVKGIESSGQFIDTMTGETIPY